MSFYLSTQVKDCLVSREMQGPPLSPDTQSSSKVTAPHVATSSNPVLTTCCKMVCLAARAQPQLTLANSADVLLCH